MHPLFVLELVRVGRDAGIGEGCRYDGLHQITFNDFVLILCDLIRFRRFRFGGRPVIRFDLYRQVFAHLTENGEHILVSTGDIHSPYTHDNIYIHRYLVCSVCRRTLIPIAGFCIRPFAVLVGVGSDDVSILPGLGSDRSFDLLTGQ